MKQCNGWMRIKRLVRVGLGYSDLELVCMRDTVIAIERYYLREV